MNKPTVIEKENHIHDNPVIDCPVCGKWIRSPIDDLPHPHLRTIPYPESLADKKRRKMMEKIVDYEFAKIKDSKTLRTPWGVLIWTPKQT